jgi:Peptidase family M23/LysM domain
MALLVPACPAAAPVAQLAAAPASAAAPARAPTTCTTMYTVVSGDSWFAIAKKTGVSQSSLYSANGTSASSPLFPGMQLCLPAGATATTVTGTTPLPAGQLPVNLAAFPAQGPCWFIDSWQSTRGGGRLHEGVDIMAKAGLYVYAVQDGTLSKQTLDRPGSLSGNAWWLSGSDGTYFFYAHLSAFAPDLKVGSKVVAGQIIGFVGRTGNASGAHLHFEVHPRGGAAVNPTPIVRAVDGCKNTTPPPQPSGTVPPTPNTVAPAGSATTAPATTPAPSPTPTPAVTTPAPVVPTNTAPTTPAAGSAWQFISPKTAYDSSWNGGSLAAFTRQTVKVSGLAGVPSGTAGVLVRLTVAGASSSGYLVTYACETGAPVASQLTFRQGGGAVGTSMVRVVKGQICVVSSVSAKVKVEVLAAQAASGVGLQAITATRVLDTRTTGRLAPGQQIQIANSLLGAPADAQALSVAVTFVNPDAAGTFSMGFCGQGLWNMSMNSDPVSSFAMSMRVSPSGWCLTSTVATDVIIDVTGLWVGTSKISTVDPLRIFDSRSSGGVGQTDTPVQVAGLGGVPAGSSTALLAITLVTGGGGTSVFAFPCNEGPISGTVIAAVSNRVTTAMVPVRLSGGQVCLRSINAADVIVDVVGAG